MRTIEIETDNSHSCFKLLKLDRSKLYGSKQQITVDKNGEACVAASLTLDGQYVLPKGSTAMLYLDEVGDVVERDDLIFLDNEDNEIKVLHSTLDQPHTIGEAISPDMLLNYNFKKIYALDPVSIAPAFESKFLVNMIYRITFQYSLTHSPDESFIIKTDAGWFIIIGTYIDFDFIEQNNADLCLPDMETDESWDDLDFGMM